MSNSTGAALKALLEGASLGLAVYRDQAPEKFTYPYATVSESISVVDEEAFNAWTDPLGHVREEVDIDLWQEWRNPKTKAMVEDPALADEVYQVLRAASLPTAPTYVAGLTVTGVRRLFEPENNVVHHVISCEVRRVLAREDS